MKVSVVFIGTGNYLNFLPEWYNSCEEYLFPGVSKQYLIFTDGEIDDLPDNMTLCSQEHLSWPSITLLRFEIIQKARKQIEETDWLVFLDADMKVVNTITVEEVLDDTKKYIGVHHPCHFMKFPPHNKFPGSLETNPLSKSCVKEDADFSVYYQGCLWGGKVPDVLGMIDELSNWINEDSSKNVIAIWHDESHLNKFLIENKEEVNTLGPEYAYPEAFSSYCDFEPKIIHLSKDNSKHHI
jgi:hypothetical protein